MKIEAGKKRASVWWILAVLVVVFVLAGGIYEEREFILSSWEKAKLIPMPERFTELYFANPASLPKQAVAGSPISFSFVIHNLEGVTTTYPYSAYFIDGSGTDAVFASGTVSLSNDASDTIAASYTFPKADEADLHALGEKIDLAVASSGVAEAGTVVVDLTSLDQQIDFILPDTH